MGDASSQLCFLPSLAFTHSSPVVEIWRYSPSLKVVLHLGKVEVRSSSSLDELVSVVEEEESKVEDGSRHRGSVDEQPGLVEMPSSRSGAKEKQQAEGS